MRVKLVALILGIIIAVAGIITILAVKAGKHTLISALTDLEDQDYDDAIIGFNKLIPQADYEEAEKYYYFRAKAISRLAEELDRCFDEELKKVSLGREYTPDYKKSLDKINRKLDKINAKIEGDLELVLGRPRSAIVTKGKFYDEFAAQYKGSGLIEVLDFDQLKKIIKIQEGDKPLRSIVQFYKQYPNTRFIAHLVKMLFEQLQKDGQTVAENSTVIQEMLISYALKYPTSPEMNMIYTCIGDGVNIRNSPGVNAQRVGAIPKDAVLLQLEKSMDTSQAGDTRDYWYRVADLSGQKGWIFGKFLKPFDVSKYKIEDFEEKWTLHENFASWTDSNTPEKWQHVDNGVTTAISFSNSGSSRIAVLNSEEGKRAGLYSRYNTSRKFSILVRGRYTGGERVLLFAYCLDGEEVFPLWLENEMIEICGRTIPLHTSDWHDYRLESRDGKFATLLVDGEILSGRIAAEKREEFVKRGIYLLCSTEEESSKGEAQYLKTR